MFAQWNYKIAVHPIEGDFSRDLFEVSEFDKKCSIIFIDLIIFVFTWNLKYNKVGNMVLDKNFPVDQYREESLEKVFQHL